MKTAALTICIMLSFAQQNINAEEKRSDSLEVYFDYCDQTGTYVKFSWNDLMRIEKERQESVEIKLDELNRFQSAVVEYSQVRLSTKTSIDWSKVFNQLKPIIKKGLNFKGQINITNTNNLAGLKKADGPNVCDE
jgi:hypothetical protein